MRLQSLFCPGDSSQSIPTKIKRAFQDKLVVTVGCSYSWLLLQWVVVTVGCSHSGL